MRIFRKLLPFALSTLLVMGLASCSDDQDESLPTGSGMEPVTDMASLDGMWSVGDATRLYFDSGNGYYAFRNHAGLGGQGDFYEVNGKPMIKFNGFLYDFLLRDDGVLLPNQNGESADHAYGIHRFTFRPDEEAEIVLWNDSNWDGMWQNAAGETIVIDTSIGQYISCSPDYYISGTLGDENEGMGLSLYDNGEHAYLCGSDDGSSFKFAGGYYSDRYSSDGRWDGVFYRNGDIDTYTDLSQAEFYYENGDYGAVWYFDGVSTYCLGYDYEIGEDGLAYFKDDGLLFPAGWLPEQPYDPADEWGEDWMDNWDI